MIYENVIKIEITKTEQHHDYSMWSTREFKDKTNQAIILISRFENYFNKAKGAKVSNFIAFETKSIISTENVFMIALSIRADENEINKQDFFDIAEAARKLITISGACIQKLMNDLEMAPNYIKIIPSNGPLKKELPGIITAPKQVAELVNIIRSSASQSAGIKFDIGIGNSIMPIIYNQKNTSLIDDFVIELCRCRIYSVCDQNLRAKISIDGNCPREVSFEPETRNELLLAQISRADILVEMNNGFSHHNGEKKLTSSRIISARPTEQDTLLI